MDNRNSFLVQWVKDLVLSMQQLGLLLWHKFDPWPRNFHMPQVWPKKKKKERKKGNVAVQWEKNNKKKRKKGNVKWSLHFSRKNALC